MIQPELKKATEEALTRLGQEYRIKFEEFETEKYSQGGYRSGKWTYKISSNVVALDYWFSSFSSRKEEVGISYPADGDAVKLENDLRDCLTRVRQFVNRKKGMF